MSYKRLTGDGVLIKPVGVDPDEAVRRLFGRGLIYTVLTMVQMTAGFASAIVLTRLLPTREYGEVAAALVVFTTLSIFAGAGLPEGIPRALFDGPDGPISAQRLVAATGLLAVCVSGLAAVTGPLWAPVLSLKYSATLQTAVWGGCLAATMFAGQAVLRAADQVRSFVAVTFIGTVLAQVLGLTSAAIWSSASAYMGGLVAGTAGGALLGVLLTGSYRHGLPSGAVLRQSLKFGSALIPNSFSLYLVASADRVVIIGLLGLAAAGRYQVAYAIGSIGVALATAINAAWLPMLLAADPDERWEMLAATSRVVYQFGVLASCAIAVAAPFVLKLAAPSSYRPEALVNVTAIVAPSMLVYLISSTHSAALFLLGKTRVLLIAAPLAGAANIGLNLLLLPIIGLVGASLATVAAYAVLGAVMAAASRRHVHLHGVTRDTFTAVLATIPLIAAGVLIPLGAAGDGVRVLLEISLGVASIHVARNARAQRHRPVAPRPDESAIYSP